MAYAPVPNAFDTESNVLGSRRVTFKFTAGTAGAAPTTLTRGNDYVSLVTKSTNDYVLSLRQRWYGTGGYNVQVRQASFSAAGACYGNITDDSATASTPTLTLSFYKGSDGTAVALTTGDIVTVTVELTNEKP